MKIAFLHDQNTVFSHKNVSSDIVSIFPNFCDFKAFSYDDELKDIAKFEPDLIFYIHSIKADLHIHLMKRAYGKKYKTACWLLEDPFNIDETAYVGAFYDLVFSIDDSGVDERRYFGYKNVYPLYQYANSAIYKPMEVGEDYKSDVLFIGVGFPSRRKLLDDLVGIFYDYHFTVIGWWWDRLENGGLKKFCTNKIIEPKEAAKFINGTKILIEHNRDYSTMNHRDIKPFCLGRGFNGAACGTFQLIDSSRKHLHNFFGKDSEIATYKDSADLNSKIHYYMENQEERDRIAKGGFERSKEHSLVRRLHELMRVYAENFS